MAAGLSARQNPDPIISALEGSNPPPNPHQATVPPQVALLLQSAMFQPEGKVGPTLILKNLHSEWFACMLPGPRTYKTLGAGIIINSNPPQFQEVEEGSVPGPTTVACHTR